MLTRLSSKGQVVIPRQVREALGLKRGVRFDIHLDDGKIVLEPVIASPVEALHGKYAGADLLNDLEEEHRQEINGEAALRP
jgi:AbrB family looped-hinge helix DNA binding protein